MTVIGLIGEDPYDTEAIRNLLQKKYSTQARFVSISKRLTGGQLDLDKFFRTLKIEAQKCHMVVCMRDLDGFSSEGPLIQARTNWFENVRKNVGCTSVFLLNVWELEAILLGDIETFNKFYKSSLNYIGNPSAKQNPKEWLKSKTQKLKRQYKESDCPELFSLLDYAKLLERCQFFSTFIVEFDRKLKDCA